MDSPVYQKLAFVERHHWWFRARQKIIHTQLEALLPRHSKILDIGCGTGALTESLQAFGEVTGCDDSLEALALCAHTSQCQTINTTELFANDPVKYTQYDLLCFFDVLEHVSNDKEFIKKFLPYLRPKGLIIITVPAFNFFWGHHDVVSHHLRRYTKNEIETLMSELGFTVVKRSYFNFLLSPLILFSRFIEKFNFISKQESGDLDLPKTLLNNFLYKIFRIEAKILKKHSIPFGVSFLGIYTKN